MDAAADLKTAARELVDRLPEGATWDDLMYEIYVRQAVEEGLADVAAGRTVSAAEARALNILRPDDGITFNRDRLLADAKARALAMVEGYAPPAKPEFRLPGAAGRTARGRALTPALSRTRERGRNSSRPGATVPK